MRYLDIMLAVLIISIFFISLIHADIWLDNFEGPILDPQWSGDKGNFTIIDGMLKGINAHPIMLIPLRFITVGNNWVNYTVRCRINIVTPNLLVCSKGALILRYNNGKGYVFALHVATETVEIYRLENNDMLVLKKEPIKLERWYQARAELQGDDISFFLDDKLVGQINDKVSISGAVGLGVEDALSVLFDDFSVTGPDIPIRGGKSAILRKLGNLPIVWGEIKK